MSSRRSPRRLAALLAAVSLLAAGCGVVAREAREAASDVAGAVREEASDVAGQVREQASEFVSEGGARGGGSGDTGGGGGGGVPPAPQVDDLGRVGANGRAILRPSVARLVVEVDVQEGVRPDPAALDHLLGILGSVTDKPGGITTAGGGTFSSERTTWSAADLRAVAAEHRDHTSTADTAVIYLLYVRGSFADRGAIGVALNASEVAVFPERWEGTLAGLLGGDREVEEAVVVHEVGHLLGLVNLTYRSEIDHEDPEHPGHSSNRGSVMFWAMDSTAIGQIFSGPPPDDFDDADRADLEGLRTGKY